MKTLALLLLFEFLFGCAPLSTIGTYTRPASICSPKNPRAMSVDVLLRDSEQHTEWVGVARPGEHVCASWSLPGDRGRWGFVSLGVMDHMDTTWGLWFQAWSIR